MHKERDYIRVGGNAWGFGGLGWYVGMCCGELRLIHHTAGELFNAWQAPWSLVNRINKISISQKMKASCHKLFQQNAWIWARVLKGWFLSSPPTPTFSDWISFWPNAGIVRSRIVNTFGKQFQFYWGSLVYFQARILFSVLNCCKRKQNHRGADFPNRCILNKGVDVIKWR